MTVLEGPKRFVNSRRFKLLLPWISALVLLVGIGAFLGTHFVNTAKVDNPNPSGAAIPPAVPQKNIKFPQAAWAAAREFVFTALTRKDLARSYEIAYGDVRGGLSLKEWETGEITVPVIPVAQMLKWNWKNTNYAHPRDAQINVILIPTKESKQRQYYAQIGLIKVGNGSDARWLVNYFQMLHGVPVPVP